MGDCTNRWETRVNGRRRWLGTLLVATAVGCVELQADRDNDGWLAGDDCDDTDPRVHAEAVEVCDGVDNNCDGAVDESSAQDAGDWFLDRDGDGYGDASEEPVQACDRPPGMAARAGDCDDTRADRHPATEWYVDSDGDQYGDPGGERRVDCWAPTGFSANASDCDDTSAATHPGAAEICNGIDDDCDAAIDEDDHRTFYEDKDGDGFGNSRYWEDDATVQACAVPEGFVENATDCDDDDLSVHPDAERICGDGIDNACDEVLGRDIEALACTMGLDDAAVRVLGAQEEEAFGGRVAVVRDLYGTHDDALVVGAMGHRRSNDVETGAVWVFQVSSLLDAPTTDGWVEPEVSGVVIEGLGSSEMSSGISSAGDVDGDGIPDLAIGAHTFDTLGLSVDVVPDQDGQNNSGGLFVIPGAVLRASPAGTVIAGADYLWTYGSFTADWVGGSVTFGDLNGDGISDVVAGATGLNGSHPSDGSLLDKVGGFAVVFGTDDETAPEPVSILNLEAEGRGVRLLGIDGEQLSVGHSVDAGDLTGDGIAELVIGVLREDSEKGGVYLVEGPLELDASLGDRADGHLMGADENGSFGSLVKIVPPTPSCDDSGYATVYVVASSTSEGMPRQAGAVYSFEFAGVMPGEVGSAPGIASGRIQGATPDRRLGRSLAVGGQVDDADCHPDLVVSGWPDSGADLRGHAQVYLGPVHGVQEEQDARAVLFGEEPYARAGEALTFARAPSLMEASGYPGARDAVVVGSDRFDRDDGTGPARENAGAVHLVTDLGY